MKKLIIGIMAALAAAGAFAASPAFTYQGVIKEVGGAVPVNKNRTIEFRLYDGPTTSASVLWGRAYSVLLDANGLFNTAITDAAGSEINGVTGTGLAGVLARNAGTTLYIGLTVDGSSGEISPRQALLAVPYAIPSADAAAASGEFTVEGKAMKNYRLVCRELPHREIAVSSTGKWSLELNSDDVPEEAVETGEWKLTLE